MCKQCKRVFLVGIVVFLWITNSFAQGLDTLWTRTYGGRLNYNYGRAVQQISGGGYIIVGYTHSYGAGEEDVYLIKTDANGYGFWAKVFGGTQDDRGYSVQQTLDGGYIVAGWTMSFGVGGSDVYLVKTNVDGDTLWTKTYGGGNDDEGHSVIQTFDGGYIVAGWTASFGAGGGDVWLIKADVNGDTVWTRTYGGIDEDRGYSVQQTSDSGYIIAGYMWSYAGGADVYLIKTDADGDTLWTRTYGGIGWDVGYSVQQTSDEGYIIAGYTNSTAFDAADIYLVKTDANGNKLWTRMYGGPDLDWGYSARQTSDEGYIVAGETYSFGAGLYDVYLIKTDINGRGVWARTYGGTSSDGGYSIQKTSDGGYIIVGYTASFGVGHSNVWLIKTGPETGVEEKEAYQENFFILHSEPNPFRDRTLIKYELPKSSNVQIVIYNLLGQEIRTLVNKKEDAGTHTVTWDVRDNSSEKVSSGVYFLKFEIENYNTTKKLLIMR